MDNQTLEQISVAVKSVPRLTNKQYDGIVYVLKAYYGHPGRPGMVGGSMPRRGGSAGGSVQSPVRGSAGGSVQSPVRGSAGGDDGFPKDLSSLEEVSFLGGSTQAYLMRDATGKLYVKKTGNSNEHIQSEYQTNQIYEAIGVAVPKTKLYDNGTVMLSEHIQGKELGTLKNTNPELYDKAIKSLQKGFAADALVANWDVIGISMDNIIVDRDGKAYRVDNGGGLTFRAQGADKKLSDSPTELWTMRSKEISGISNPSAQTVFKDKKIDSVMDGVKRVIGKRKEILDATPKHLQGSMAKRLDAMEDMLSTYQKMKGVYQDRHLPVESCLDNFLFNYKIPGIDAQFSNPVNNLRFNVARYSGELEWTDDIGDEHRISEYDQPSQAHVDNYHSRNHQLYWN